MTYIHKTHKSLIKIIRPAPQPSGDYDGKSYVYIYYLNGQNAGLPGYGIATMDELVEFSEENVIKYL